MGASIQSIITHEPTNELEHPQEQEHDTLRLSGILSGTPSALTSLVLAILKPCTKGLLPLQRLIHIPFLFSRLLGLYHSTHPPWLFGCLPRIYFFLYANYNL